MTAAFAGWCAQFASRGSRGFMPFRCLMRSASANVEAALGCFPQLGWVHGNPEPVETGRFHTRVVLSMLAVASSRLSGLNATP